MAKNRYHDWLSQSENVLLWGKDSLKNGFPAQACFIAQQASEKALKKLDIYYITSRYPDSMPEGAPFENFSDEQADEALGLAEMIIGRVKDEIK